MVTIELARQLAQGLPEVEEKGHFGMPSFRVKNKIFATLQPDLSRAMVKLNPIDQSVFCLSENYWPVPGVWGKQGATFVNLKKVSKSMFNDSLTLAWVGIAPKKIRAAYPAVGKAR